MNCPWHPEKRVVAICKDCGTEFCIECVRETDQTTLCPDCYRRKLSDIAREFTEPEEKKEERRAAPVSTTPEETPRQRKAAPAPEDEFEATAARAAPASRREGRKKGRDGDKRKKPAVETPPPPHEDFLSQGPDEDFSQLTTETSRMSRWSRVAKKAGAVMEAAGAEPPEEEPAATVTTVMPGTAEKRSAAAQAAASDDSLLQDVMSTLLKPEAGTAAVEAWAAAAPERAVSAQVEAEVRWERLGKEKARVRKKEGKAPRERDAERWSFLAQPRSSEYTLIAVSWWRAAIFIALMLLGGAAIWALINVYAIPKDMEYGILAIVIGIAIGIAFWWKAGKKHSTKLAVQAALTTFFALFIGEFLHWFLIVLENKALRTIFFDLVSFKFLWENGAEIMENVMKAMFPAGFILILLLPTFSAFIIGFGLPPIPEILVQFWHAIRGRTPEEKEASRGLEG